MNFNDERVQATGGDAAISKVSCATKGYVEDPFIHLFVEPSRRKTRRAPLINRGYYARTKCVDQIVHSFLQQQQQQQRQQHQQQHQHQSASATNNTNTSTTPTTSSVSPSRTAQIITLGAGSDTLFFRLQTSHPELFNNVNIYETDFETVVHRKQRIVAAHESLRTMAASDQYHIFSCDLRDLTSLTNGLKHCGFDPNVPTLLLSECVLIYMEPTYSNRVIQWSATHIRASVFVTYEQIKPLDAFGAMMVRNIQQRGCPLKSIHQYPTLEALTNRYKELGYRSVNVRDMNDVYYHYIDSLDRQRAEKLELFDELEEWHLIQGHYCLAVAVNQGVTLEKNDGVGVVGDEGEEGEEEEKDHKGFGNGNGKDKEKDKKLEGIISEQLLDGFFPKTEVPLL